MSQDRIGCARLRKRVPGVRCRVSVKKRVSGIGCRVSVKKRGLGIGCRVSVKKRREPILLTQPIILLTIDTRHPTPVTRHPTPSSSPTPVTRHLTPGTSFFASAYDMLKGF